MSTADEMVTLIGVVRCIAFRGIAALDLHGVQIEVQGV